MESKDAGVPRSGQQFVRCGIEPADLVARPPSGDPARCKPARQQAPKFTLMLQVKLLRAVLEIGTAHGGVF